MAMELGSDVSFSGREKGGVENKERKGTRGRPQIKVDEGSNRAQVGITIKSGHEVLYVCMVTP